MVLQEFFPPRPHAAPTIYAFASTHPDHAGLLKVGYTGGNKWCRFMFSVDLYKLTPFILHLSLHRADMRLGDGDVLHRRRDGINQFCLAGPM